jgi:hypothetical protein
VVQIDSSNVEIGATLTVAFANRRGEQRYSTMEKECLTITQAQQFDPYLYGKQFVVETDYQLSALYQKENSGNTLLFIY